MPVVIDEVESQVEPAGNRGKGGDSDTKQEKPKSTTMQQLAPELCRMERRMARLKAD